jgi:hypothetical protein
MATQPEAGDSVALASYFARLATGGDERYWALGADRLGEFDARSWLLVDDAARRYTYSPLPAVGGVKGWLSADTGEPSGFVATVTSWHCDGRFRERATRILGQNRGSLRGPALAVRLLDHVPQVRVAALEGLAADLPLPQAGAALGVVLAGRDRRQGPAALNALTGILRAHGIFQSVVQSLLTRTHETAARRWAYATARDEQMLTAEMLHDAVRSEHDQFLRAQCARWLVGLGVTLRQVANGVASEI